MVNVGLELDDDVAASLYHLRDKRKVDLSAWVQGLIRLALPEELQDPETAPALVGWTPLKLDDDSWGAVHHAPDLLPGALAGRRIVISAKGPKGRARIWEIFPSSRKKKRVGGPVLAWCASPWG